MATPTFKNNILDLLCRACLKMKKTRFNIFEHKKNDRLLADMIRDCTSVKIQNDDGLPVNLCDECNEKLNSACDFKEMVIQSSLKLQNFYNSKKLDNETNMQSNDENLNIKEESWTKPEKSQHADRNIANNNEQNYLYSRSNKKNFSEKKCDAIQNQQIIEEEIFAGKLDIVNLDQCKFKTQYISPGDIDNFFDSMDSLDTSLDESSTYEKSKKRKQSVSRIKPKRRRGNINNHNEKQAALLDNSDYRRIISSNLTKKEKDCETVFCGECKKTFSFRYYVAVHAYAHTGNVPYKCEKCDKCYPKQSELKRHLRSHTQTRDFTCDECGKAFFRKQQMQYHKASKHSDERPHKCNICEKTFKIPSALWKHALIHVNDRKFVCEICGRGFLEMVGLTKHKITHTTERNFVCTICGKSFLRKRDLNWHTKKHSEDKPHACSYCGRRFHCTTVLKNHILTHTGAKPFSCGICGKTFRQRSCIGRHMRIHTGETPFPCTLCPLSFKYKHHLNNHMKIHEKEVAQTQVNVKNSLSEQYQKN